VDVGVFENEAPPLPLPPTLLLLLLLLLLPAPRTVSNTLRMAPKS
jgi:hypothetical protein